MSSYDPNVNWKSIIENFFKIIIVRGNQALFINKDLQKAKYTKTRLKRKYWQGPSRENEVPYKKKKRNLCVLGRRKSITNCFNKFSNKGLET